MATHSSVLAWRIPEMGELGGLSSMGLHRVGHDWSNLAAAAATLAEDTKKKCKNTQKNFTKKSFMTQIIMMVWSSRARHPGMWSQVGLRNHHCEQSWWRWWNCSWAISNSERWCCESDAFNMPTNLENSVGATGLEKVSFHSNHKEKQCQRTLKLPHNCTHLTR